MGAVAVYRNLMIRLIAPRMPRTPHSHAGSSSPKRFRSRILSVPRVGHRGQESNIRTTPVSSTTSQHRLGYIVSHGALADRIRRAPTKVFLGEDTVPSLSDLTSRDAVLAAIKECDTLGRDAFLKKYGYRYSRLYPLLYQGKRYDSKAIVGVAVGKQLNSTPLRARDFSGGVATVLPVLTRLGFDARPMVHPGVYLEPGKTYPRTYLLELYGGQHQRGIWTPKEFPVVFMFTGTSGAAYGYRDGWTSEGVFQYTGEGQTGGMTFTSGNAAIRDHRKLSRDLLLFEDLGKGRGVRYVGMFDCAGWGFTAGTDKRGHSRQLIIFDLVPVTTGAARQAGESQQSAAAGQSLSELRETAYKAATMDPPQSKAATAKRAWYERSKQVRDYVLARAQGICEACKAPAPFTRPDGTPYLEPHHTRRLADDGPDHPEWVGAICPTCHRRIHYGADGASINTTLQQSIRATEQTLADLPTRHLKSPLA